MFWTQPPKTDLYVFFLHSFIFTQCYYFSSFVRSVNHIFAYWESSLLFLSHLFRKSRPTRVLLLLLPIPFFSSKGDEELRSCSPSFSSSFLFVQSISRCIVFNIKHHPVRWRKLLWWCIVKSYYKLGKLLLQKLNSSSR